MAQSPLQERRFPDESVLDVPPDTVDSPRSADDAGKKHSAFLKFPSFRNKGSKPDKKPDKKQQILDYQEKIRTISSDFNNVVRENEELKRAYSEILRNNPYSQQNIQNIQNLQIGSSNELSVFEGDDNLTDSIADLKSLINSLTDNLNENIEELEKKEKSLKESQVMLKETKDGLRKFKNRFEQKSTGDSNQFSELQLMLKSLTGDLSDEHVIKEGIGALITFTNNQKFNEFEKLPSTTQLAILRIVNKFDVELSDFARCFGASKDSLQKDVRIRGELVLNTETCAVIISNWVLIDDKNGPDLLLDMLKKLDQEHTEYMVQERKNRVGNANHNSYSMSSVSTIGSSIPNRNHDHGDRKLWYDMKSKIDEIHAKLIGAGSTTSTPSNQPSTAGQSTLTAEDEKFV